MYTNRHVERAYKKSSQRNLWSRGNSRLDTSGEEVRNNSQLKDSRKMNHMDFTGKGFNNKKGNKTMPFITWPFIKKKKKKKVLSLFTPILQPSQPIHSNMNQPFLQPQPNLCRIGIGIQHHSSPRDQGWPSTRLP